MTISPDGRSAALEMLNVAVVDQPKWPALDAVGIPATMSFKMTWTATGEKIVYDDPEKQFRVEGYRAIARIEAEVNAPSIGFSWKSDPASSSPARFAIIGDEVNGRYYGLSHKSPEFPRSRHAFVKTR
ncbi:MAG TPA: hypothetical protein VEZ90_07530 [Blastocatellia bacterium]|nr:hypothetical protein [Blastocatellia bacterium]